MKAALEGVGKDTPVQTRPHRPDPSLYPPSMVRRSRSGVKVRVGDRIGPHRLHSGLNPPVARY